MAILATSPWEEDDKTRLEEEPQGVSPASTGRPQDLPEEIIRAAYGDVLLAPAAGLAGAQTD